MGRRVLARCSTSKERLRSKWFHPAYCCVRQRQSNLWYLLPTFTPPDVGLARAPFAPIRIYTRVMNDSLTTAAAFLPASRSLTALRAAAARCRGCDLYRHATQTVFGAGPAHARLLLIGEQPGDREDRDGRPFVGPAGALLDRALAQANIARKEVYVTNAVKHFKWERRGKRRLHKHPEDREIVACHPWLAAEIAAVKPQVVVCLGVTAARAVFERVVRLKDLRGSFHPSPLAELTLVTTHPAALLRLPAAATRKRAFREFVAELALAAEALK